MGTLSFSLDDKYNAFLRHKTEVTYGDGPLSGIPVAIKDNISTIEMETTCASQILSGYTAPYNAHVIDLLLASGAAIVGKTNMDEFAMGTTTENSAYGKTLNPRDITRVPGGSSGGSAAAVAGNLVPMALGSDTGGSIRCPAAFCGIVGLKPSYGRVSRYGLIAYANSLEQIGPMAKTVTETAQLFSVIAGHDKRDASSLDAPYKVALDPELKGKRIAVPEEFFGAGVHPGVAETVRDAIDIIAGAGAEIIPCSIPSMKYALSAYYVICTSEASSNLGRFDGIEYGKTLDTKKSWHDAYQDYRMQYFGPEVRRRILLGTFSLAAGYYGRYYHKAQTARQMITKEYNHILSKADAIMGPTMPEIAFPFGAKSDPLTMYQTDILTVPANLAGLPALSVPCGTVEGMPVGLQIIGASGNDEMVLNLGYGYEEMAS